MKITNHLFCNEKHLLLTLILSIFHLMPYCQRLVAYYPLNNSVIDLSGNKNNGYIFGDLKSCQDRFNNPCGAYEFNGKNSYIQIPNSLSLENINREFTLTCWFKLTGACLKNNEKWLTLICKGGRTEETNNSPQYRVQSFQGNYQSTISINTEFTEYDNQFNQHLFKSDLWNFYAVTYDGRAVTAYLNGDKIWEFPFTSFFQYNSEPLYIGVDFPGNLEYFCGSLDEIRLYSGSLSYNQILDVYYGDIVEPESETMTLTCPKNILIFNSPGKCGNFVDFPTAELKLNCGDATITQQKGPISGSFFNIGTTDVMFKATNDFGEVQTCLSKIMVVDNEAPVLNCCRDTTLFISVPGQTSVEYSYPSISGQDNCGFLKIQQIAGLPSGSQFKLGTTILEFQATDGNNNISSCSCKVTVKNNAKQLLLKPLDCPDDITTNNDRNKCGAKVSYILDPSFTNLHMIGGIASNNFFPVGTTMNTFESYLNSESRQYCTFKVMVIDNEKPKLICPPDIVTTSSSNDGIKINYALVNAFDNCAVDTLFQVEGVESGELFPVGTTYNTFIACDENENCTSCSFTVLVESKINAADIIIPDSVTRKGVLNADNCTLTIVLYDDGIQDSDTISVYFNTEEIVKREGIKLKKNGTIIRELHLNPLLENEFIVRAWNNGMQRPNTLRVDFFKGSYLNKTLLEYSKPDITKIFHSSPGLAEAVYLRCN